MVIAIFDVGFGEGFVILVIALLLFGGQLPDVVKNVGRVVGELKRSAQGLSRELRSEIDRPPAARPPPPAVVPRPRRNAPAAEPAESGTATTAPGATSTQPRPPAAADGENQEPLAGGRTPPIGADRDAREDPLEPT